MALDKKDKMKLVMEAKAGKLSDDKLKYWLENAPEDKATIIQNGWATQEKIKQIFTKTPQEHRQIFNSGGYSVDSLKKLKASGDIDATEAERMISELYIKQLYDGTISLDDIRRSSDLSNNERIQIITDYHKENIRRERYTSEQIGEALNKKELLEEDLQGVMSEEEIRELFPCTVTPDFMRWTDLPDLILNRTDIFVLGVPGSGKSMLMAGMIYYASINGHLDYLIHNKVGAKYLNQLKDVVKNGCLIAGTAHERLQYMACDFVDDESDKHPLTFIEMSGEVFKQFYNGEKIPEILLNYFQSENNKVITLVVDYTEENKRNISDADQSTQLSFALKILEENGALARTEAINIVVTKWDLAQKNRVESPGQFLKEHGYLQLERQCATYAQQYGLDFSFETFSLGSFYGMQNKKYKYNPDDSKKLFDWYCDNTAIINEGRTSKKTPPVKSKKGNGWKWF